MTNLPILPQPEDHCMVLVAQRPHDHDQWNEVLPVSTPLYAWDGAKCRMIRWVMSRENAERFGYWGNGCRCCGVERQTTGDTWQFDTELRQIDWYFERTEA